MYYIPQITNNDCLFTAFKMLLANVKKDEKYLYLQEDEKHGAYSLLEIIEKGKAFGVELFGFEADNKNELKNCKNVPLILNIKVGTQSLHSVFVYKVTERNVYYLDSDAGRIKMSFEKFISQWDGKGLMTRTVNEVENEPEPFLVEVKRNPMGNFFQLLSAICFIFGLYFIDGKTNIFIPIGLIIGGVIIEVITKVIQIKDMKKFDSQTNDYLDKVKSKNYFEFLPRREKLKLSIFSLKNNYMFYFISCAFVIFVVLLNNPLNVACIVMPIILAMIQCFFIRPLEKKKSMEIELLEVKFSKEKSSASASKSLKQIEKEAYGFSYSVLGKNAIGIILFFVASFVTLKLLNAFDLINIFFLVFTEIFLYQNLLPLFTYESRKIEEKLNYMRFINLLQ